MAYGHSRTVQGLHDKHGLNKPTMTRLLGHIISSIFSNGMISLLILGSASVACLRYYNSPSSHSFALLIGTIIVLGSLRGCKAWQEDLNCPAC